MARIVVGKPPFVGTRDNLTIYPMNGEYIVRTKSSLTGKRVKRDPAFAKTMENAGRLKQASGIASCVYKQMPVNERVYKQYRELVGKAMCLLKEDLNIDHVVIFLEATYLPDKSKDNNRCADKSSAKPFVKQVKKRADNNRHSITSYRYFERECAGNKRRRNRSVYKAIEKECADNRRRNRSVCKAIEKEYADNGRRNRSVCKPIEKECADNRRRNRSVYKAIEKECADNGRRNRSGGRFQVGIAGLRLFDTRLMRLYRYSKAHTLENAP